MVYGLSQHFKGSFTVAVGGAVQPCSWAVAAKAGGVHPVLFSGHCHLPNLSHSGDWMWLPDSSAIFSGLKQSVKGGTYCITSSLPVKCPRKVIRMLNLNACAVISMFSNHPSSHRCVWFQRFKKKKKNQNAPEHIWARAMGRKKIKLNKRKNWNERQYSEHFLFLCNFWFQIVLLPCHPCTLI